MARMRTIKPEFWTDDKVVELSILSRLLFIGLWNFADDDGFIEYSPKRIKRLIFPDQQIDVEDALQELIQNGFLCINDSDQGELLQICQFSTHQRPQHPLKTKFTGISRREHDGSIVLMRTHEVSLSRVEESSVVNTLVQPTVERKKEIYSDDFMTFWKSYPRRQQKGDAWKAWETLRKNKTLPDVEILVSACNAYSKRVTDPQFIKLPAGWLRSAMWEDEPVIVSTAWVDPFDRPPAPEGRRYAADILDSDLSEYL